MKSIFWILLLIFLASCTTNSKDENFYLGEWQLIEVYSDPGDGSGSFELVDSDKRIQFFEDGRVLSNGTLCKLIHFSNAIGQEEMYSIEDNLIRATGCSFEETIFLDLEMDNTVLTLSYVCDEACIEKYIRLN